MAGGYGEVNILQDRTVRAVGEVDVFEAYFAVIHSQGFGIRRILDGGFIPKQFEQALHVYQGLADFPVDETQGVQGDEQLDQVGVYHGEVAQGDLATGHFAHRHGHDDNQCHADDQRLTGVQGGQGQTVFQPGLFPVVQVLVVEFGFVAFVVEVFDGFIVQQAVDGPGVGLVVPCISFPHELGSPLGDFDGEHNVHHHRHQNGENVTDVEYDQQDGRHKQDFQDGGHNVEQGKAQQEADAVGTPFNVTGQATGFSVQVKTQLALMQVFKHSQRHPPHGPFRHPGKHGIPQFAEQGGAKAQATVGHDQHNRNPQQHVGAAILVQVIDDVFQGHRRGDRGQFRQYQ